MKNIDFSRHSIADIRGWDENNNLEVQPDFQRRAVWSGAAKVMLIDSIIKNIPLPKVFIASKIRNGRTHRIVIDGQQRISAILGFLSDDFRLVAPYSGEYKGLLFSELPDNAKNGILSFRLDFNEFENYTDSEMREIYNRVNKYTVALNKQELRRADFPGEFLNLSEKLSVNIFFDEAKVFSAANRRRLGDVEYVSELLALLIQGPQDKKSNIDSFYMNYASWDKLELKQVEDEFANILKVIETIFVAGEEELSRLRFRQKSDFYSLFGAICELRRQGIELREDKFSTLAEDFTCLDFRINPHERGLLGEYASRCLSDANSIANRQWRIDFIYNLLVSASISSDEVLVEERVKFLLDIGRVLYDDDPMCPPLEVECLVCGKEGFAYNLRMCIPKSNMFLSSIAHIHEECFSLVSSDYY